MRADYLDRLCLRVAAKLGRLEFIAQVTILLPIAALIVETGAWMLCADLCLGQPGRLRRRLPAGIPTATA